ncbi:MAG: hypothetical protein RIC57_07710 [Balneola sp.]|tara:strand:- start:22791 stop:23285 length:495 start_codon:yes stop_codon:yes gene_type:complete
MKEENFYSKKDLPSHLQKEKMWDNIESEILIKRQPNILFHWKSFLIGNAAAVLLIFSSIGIVSTYNNLFDDSSTEEQVYETLNTATKQLQSLTPLLIQQASEQNKNSIESTADAISEIDKLIDEIKSDMLFNGTSPSKEESLKRLYATKLDFYKEILLNQEDQS